MLTRGVSVGTVAGGGVGSVAVLVAWGTVLLEPGGAVVVGVVVEGGVSDGWGMRVVG